MSETMTQTLVERLSEAATKQFLSAKEKALYREAAAALASASEPVAWRYRWKYPNPTETLTHTLWVETGSGLVAQEREREGYEVQPLYASPPVASEPVAWRHELERIIAIDQREQRTCIEFDPAGSTYEVTNVDGPCAEIARRLLASPPVSLPAGVAWITHQLLTEEMDSEQREHADYEGAYNEIIKRVRQAVALDENAKLFAARPPIPEAQGVEALEELRKLRAYFNSPEGYAAFGYSGDVNGWSPADTAIAAMRTLATSPASRPYPAAQPAPDAAPTAEKHGYGSDFAHYLAESGVLAPTNNEATETVAILTFSASTQPAAEAVEAQGDGN